MARPKNTRDISASSQLIRELRRFPLFFLFFFFSALVLCEPNGGMESGKRGERGERNFPFPFSQSPPSPLLFPPTHSYSPWMRRTSRCCHRRRLKLFLPVPGMGFAKFRHNMSLKSLTNVPKNTEISKIYRKFVEIRTCSFLLLFSVELKLLHDD